MKVIVDTNVLVRTIVRDDEAQAAAAFRLLEAADVIAVSNACICELVWVLKRVYRLGRDDISAALRGLEDARTIANGPTCMRRWIGSVGGRR